MEYIAKNESIINATQCNSGKAFKDSIFNPFLIQIRAPKFAKKLLNSRTQPKTHQMNTEIQDGRTQTRSMIFKKILIFLGYLILFFIFFKLLHIFIHIIYFSFFSFVLRKWISDPASIFCFQRRVKENWKSKISYEIKKNVKNESFERRHY